MSRSVGRIPHWLQQQMASNPDLARLNAPLREARAAKAVRTPVGEEHRFRSDARPEDQAAVDFRRELLTRAKAQGWSIHETWNPTGPDRGYHCWLVKEGRLLRVEWHPEDTVLSPAHARFNMLLDTVAGVEVCLWRRTDMAMIEQTLAR